MTKTLRYLATATSTNDVAADWARAGAQHGSGVVANQQRSGRGRRSRSWFSPPKKNLYCSIILRPQIDPSDYPKLTLIAGLSVADYLQSNFKLSVGLKWPNDICIKGKKCGGILCESSISDLPADSFAIIGIGLNCLLKETDLPPTLREIATSLTMNGCRDLDPRDHFPGLKKELLNNVAELERHGFAPLLSRWRRYDFLKGQSMNWINARGEIVHGVSLGPDEEGVLHVRDRAGVSHEIVSGDVALAEKKSGASR